MLGRKCTVALAAALVSSAVPLPLALASDPSRPDGGLPQPAPIAATNSAQPAAPTVSTPLPALPPPASKPAAPSQISGAPPPSTPATTWGTRGALVRHDVHRLASPRPHLTRPRAHAAGGPNDTITDFKFSPETLTVHVGDTVTWTNSGPSPHTATAGHGGFDTGTLTKGASASHTFTQSGTFSYICTIHPFMKGTVVVLAGSGTPVANRPSGSAGTASAPSPASATPAGGSASPGNAAAPTLPVTGLDLRAVVAVGLALLVLGRLVGRRGI
jgi:plastocyanin